MHPSPTFYHTSPDYVDQQNDKNNKILDSELARILKINDQSRGRTFQIYGRFYFESAFKV